MSFQLHLPIILLLFLYKWLNFPTIQILIRRIRLHLAINNLPEMTPMAVLLVHVVVHLQQQVLDL